MKNFIINLLDLKKEDVKSIDIENHPSHNMIHIRLTRHLFKCSVYLKMTSKVRQYKKRQYVLSCQKKLDFLLIIKNHPIIITK